MTGLIQTPVKAHTGVSRGNKRADYSARKLPLGEVTRSCMADVYRDYDYVDGVTGAYKYAFH